MQFQKPALCWSPDKLAARRCGSHLLEHKFTVSDPHCSAREEWRVDYHLYANFLDSKISHCVVICLIVICTASIALIRQNMTKFSI